MNWRFQRMQPFVEPLVKATKIADPHLARQPDLDGSGPGKRVFMA
jgi:hypothetical protein